MKTHILKSTAVEGKVFCGNKNWSIAQIKEIKQDKDTCKNCLKFLKKNK